MKRAIFLAATVLLACGQKGEEAGQETTGQAGSSGSISWTVPGGWVEEAPSSSMRKAQFRLPKLENDPEDATVVVFYFGPGQGGGVMANIQRWVGQFTQADGSSAGDMAKISSATVNELKQTTVDVSGTYLFQMTPMSPVTTEKPNFRMLAAVVEHSGGPWFVKMTGPKNTIDSWEKSFKEFMNSIKR